MRAVYVDCDGTLLTLDCAYDALFERACESVGVDATPDAQAAYSERFLEAFSEFRPNPYRAGMAAAVGTGGIDADPEALAAAYVDAEVEASVSAEGARDALDALEGADTALGVLTNGVTAVQRRKLEAAGLFDRFDAYLPSYEVGAHKPDPAIFDAARDRLDAEEYVYVGDSLEHDARPAREAGFLAVHVDSGAEPGVVAVDGLDTLGRAASLAGRG
ncbi:MULTISPECIES: HAD family hydrolase [Halolamina]|uniref:Putative hydrolase of the HAD superfamily n=1 Tax=Halolamina pelagica TaxID=699431 RepID=A0A1I5SDW3_9EURY|nr:MULTISPECIES: HAD family hydrolase [Halolamina]NHX37103.1 HAD family hydrolase [Halolamina sp. R1-12]SFP68941.1 putative hydrolase of the HAD superfamily [Halolamina pelagica]